MAGPLDRPPGDHGSDRFDYVEVSAPPGISPHGLWWDALIAAPCPDCRANVFAAYDDEVADQHQDWCPDAWSITIAHDESCPTPDPA